MKHNHAGRIAVLLLDAHPNTCRLRALPKLRKVPEPLPGARREWKLWRGGVKEK